MTAVAARPSLRRPTGAGERRWPLSRVFTFGAVVAGLVAVMVVVLGAFGLVRLSAARAVVFDVTGPASLAVKDLTTAVLNQETGVRGFVLVRGSDARAPYDMGVADEQAAAASLRQLAARGGFTAVLADLDALDGAVERWRSTYAEPALAGNAPPGGGTATFDTVRAALGTLQADVDTQRNAGRAEFSAAVSFLVLVGIVIAVVLAGFLVVAAIGLRRSVLRPVSDLAAQVRDVVSGDVEKPVRADGPREIVELGEDVDAMRLRVLGDLREQREVSRRLDEQARELERSNRDLEQFAYVASHDLQEPLRKVGSFCQLLQRRYGGKLDERADQYIAFAVDGASRMQQLINDLLAFSRVGRTTSGFAPVDLAAVAESTLEQLEDARAYVDGRIEVGPLPVVDGDAGLLRQLLVNLLANALKFHRDGVPPVVTVGAERDGDEWRITIADNGIGIEPEYAEKVFVIFQRLHPRDAYPGTGIGLALAKKIVEFHGGRVVVDPPGPEPGTTVRITFPALPEPPGDDVIGPTHLPAAPPAEEYSA